MTTETENKSENILKTVEAMRNCLKLHNQSKENAKWYDRHYKTIIDTLFDILPHGSGIDNTWDFDITDKAIICYNAYHCMNETGYYTHWIHFKVIIKTTHRTIDKKLDFMIVGKFGRHQDTKEYLYDIVGEALQTL